jgi:hypothetical protein
VREARYCLQGCATEGPPRHVHDTQIHYEPRDELAVVLYGSIRACLRCEPLLTLATVWGWAHHRRKRGSCNVQIAAHAEQCCTVVHLTHRLASMSVGRSGVTTNLHPLAARDKLHRCT